MTTISTALRIIPTNDSPYISSPSNKRSHSISRTNRIHPNQSIYLKSYIILDVPSQIDQTSQLTIFSKLVSSPCINSPSQISAREWCKRNLDMIKSWRVFKPKELLKSQEPVTEERLDLEREENVSDVKTEEFVKIVKRSEYSVMEQLKKGLARYPLCNYWRV